MLIDTMNKNAINLISPLEIKIEWSRSTSEPPLTLSISALMLNKEDVIDEIDDFVFYGSKSNGKNIVSSDKAITCDKLDFAKGFGTGSLYTMNLDLDHLRKEIDHIRLVASINLKIHQPQNVSFDNFSKVEFSLKDSIGFHYTVELNQAASPDCRCIEVCLVKRYGKSWRFEEEKVNRLGGLELSYEEYGERLLKDNPFSLIGDLNIIENIYKGKKTKTEIFPDGRKKIFEKSKEFIITTIGHIKGSSGSNDTQVVGMPKSKRSTATNATTKRGKGLMPKKKQNETPAAIKSRDEVPATQSPQKRKPHECSSINKSGHGVMPNTSGNKSKTSKTKQQIEELSDSKVNDLINETEVKSDKTTSMANRFANRKNKRINNK